MPERQPQILTSLVRRQMVGRLSGTPYSDQLTVTAPSPVTRRILGFRWNIPKLVLPLISIFCP